ncbi:HD domain-containing protein [Ralstonia pseudosolanacearum]|uniref:HD domain-containing protein n=1 Tax=Ralstonia pseudosolanacearum TaxID=1310165 RepID=UPI003CF0384C
MEANWELADVRAFADKAHRDAKQFRDYTGEPYIVHPLVVVGLVATVPGHTREMIAAALLHDVCDDAGIALSEIAAKFGRLVARYVGQLSNVSRPEDGNRASRKAIEREHTAGADPEVKTIRLADLIGNCISIVILNRAFAPTYLREKVLLLEVLGDGDPGLFKMATDIVNNGLADLAESHD